jgi:hypothetical protein
MPTRKQRRRLQKERRHEYETVWVDSEGNELEEPPDDAVEPRSREKRSDGKPKPQRAQQRGSRSTRKPLPPSWQRASKRAAILGVVIFALFYLVNSKNGQHHIASALVLALVYTALFIPFTYAIDRFAYRRWERSQGAPKKR